MPNSPKCPKPKCGGQTYRVAGKPQFKCSTCKNLFGAESFKPEDFEWKEKRG